MRGRKQKKELAAAIGRGRQLVAEHRHQEAFELLRDKVEQFPEDPEIRYLYASILLAFRPQDVAAEAAKAIELGSDDPGILVRAAHLLFDRGQIDTARSCAEHANELVQSDFVHMSGLVNLEGRLADVDGQDDLAEEKLRIAVKMDPAFSSFAVDLAHFLASKGRKTEAIEVIAEAFAHCNQKAHLERARIEIEGDEASS